jgi:hypothetical protein
MAPGTHGKPNRALALVLALSAGACSGTIAQPNGTPTPGGPPPGSSSGPGTPSAAPMVPGGITGAFTGQRFTDRQYLNVVADLFAVDASSVVSAMPIDPKLEGFRNAGSVLLPSDLRIEGYANLAGFVTAKIDWTRQLGVEALCADFGDKCQQDFLARLGRRLFRRPMSPDQVKRFVPIFEAVKAEGDTFATAAGLTIQAMLQSPEFLYRLERGATRWDNYDLATRLSFLLWNSVPDDALLDSAGKADFATAGVDAQIDRMMKDPRAKRALRDYVDDWLDEDKLARTGRDQMMFPLFTPALAADMREEVQRLFERVVWSDDGDLTSVLTSDKTVVTPALAKLYGLPAPADATGWSEVSLAGNPNRQGLLTAGGVLTVTSVGSAGSSIVDRGVFVGRNLLCLNLPEPPSNVPMLPDETAGASERDRLSRHRVDPACGACHDQIDPLGIAFEQYDAIGNLQTKDAHGNALTGVGTVKVGGKDVAFKNMREFIGAIAQDPNLEACLVRKVAQYTLARPLGAQDDPLVKSLVDRFSKDGRRYKSLLVAMAGSLKAAGGGK